MARLKQARKLGFPVQSIRARVRRLYRRETLADRLPWVELDDFETFAIESMHQAGPQRPLESYFLLQGTLPKNLRLVRFENLAEELEIS